MNSRNGFNLISIAKIASIFTMTLFSACIGVIPVGGSGSLSSSSTIQNAPTTPLPATQLVLSGSPSDTAGLCYLYTLAALDQNGNPSEAVTNGQIAISGITGGQSYLDSQCSQPATMVTMTGNTSQFYLRSTQAGAFILTAQAAFGTGKLPISITAATGVSISLNGPSAFGTLTCTTFSASILDQFGNATNTGSSRQISLSLSGAAASSSYLFSDSACTVATTTATIAAGSSTGVFYVIGELTGSQTTEALSIFGSGSGLNTGSINTSVVPGSTARIAFVAPSTGIVGVCLPGNLQIQKSDNSNFSVPSNTVVSLSNGGMHSQYFASGDSTCSSPISTLTIPQGSSSTSFYFKDSQTEAVTTMGDSTYYASGSFLTTFSVNAVNLISIQATFTSLPADSCGMATAALNDQYGNATVAGSSLSLPLIATGASGSGTHFYSDSMCTVAAPNVAITSGSASGNFYFKAIQPGNLVVSLTPPAGVGVSPANFQITDSQGTPSSISLVGSVSIMAGQCNPYTVYAKDANGFAMAVSPSNLNLNLASSSLSAKFFSDSACTASTGQTAITEGNSQVTFYMKSTGVGQFTISSSSGSLSASLPITSSAGAAAALALNVPSSINQGDCAHGSISLVDAYQNPTTASATTSISLSGTLSNSSQLFSFFSDTACLNPVSSVSIASGANNTNFSFSAPVSGGMGVLTASSTGINPASQNINILAEGSYHLTINGGNSVQAGNCVAMSVSILNSSGSIPAISPTVVSLSTGAATAHLLFSDSQCANPITSVTVSDSSSSDPAPFYFKDTLAGSVTLSANTVGGLADQLCISVGAGPAYQLVIGGNSNITAQSCATGFTVSAQDSYGNPATLNSNLTVSLGGTISGTTFGQASCSPAMSSIILNLGASSSALSVLAPSAGNLTITASASGLISGTYTTNVSPAPAANFTFSAQSLSFPAINVGSAETGTIQVTNNGNLAGTISSLTFSDPAYTQVLNSSSCAASFTLQPGSSCNLSIQFKPTATGIDSAKVTLNYSGGTACLSLTGTGTGAAYFSTPNGALASFGNVNINTTSATSVLTIKNIGQVAGIPTITLNNTTDFKMDASACAAAVAPGATCNVNIQFTPNTLGAISAAVLISPSDANQDTLTSPLSGCGAVPALVVNNGQSTSESGTIAQSAAGQPTGLSTLISMNCVANRPANFVSYSVSGGGFQKSSGAPSSAYGYLLQGSFTSNGTFNVSVVMADAASPSTQGTCNFVVTISESTPPAVTASIWANGTAGYIASNVAANVTISWSSTGAVSCAIGENDLAAVYKHSVSSSPTNGTWVGPTIGQGATSGSYAVPPLSAAALRDVTYTLVCTGAGGTVTQTVRVQSWEYAAGGPVQADHLYSDLASAQSCRAKIASPGGNCSVAKAGQVWADGTPVPATVDGPAGCVCFNPNGVYDGKVWM